MKPIDFKERNVMLLGKGVVKNLPAYRDGSCIRSRWEMSLKERLSALLFGKVWLRVRAIKTQPAVSIHCTHKRF